MGPVARADMVRLVQKCEAVPPAQRSIWHNGILLLWKQVIWLERRRMKDEG